MGDYNLVSKARSLSNAQVGMIFAYDPDLRGGVIINAHGRTYFFCISDWLEKEPPAFGEFVMFKKKHQKAAKEVERFLI
jgi:hypothetical protein